MITSQASHDNTLVDQLSSVVITQPVDTDTNENSVESRICNIPCYSYDTHPRIAKYIVAVVLVTMAAFVVYSYKLCKNREESHPIISVSALIGTVTGLALIAYHSTLYTNWEASLPIIAGSIILKVILVSAAIVSLAALLVRVTLPSDHYTIC